MARIKFTEEDHDKYNVICGELKAELKVTSQPVVTFRKVLQKEGSRKGGSYNWPILMVQLISEQLVNVMPPAAMSPNIASTADIDMLGVRVILQELPSISFIRSFQTILRIIGETLAAYFIGKVEQRDKLFSGGTGRRQTALQYLVIGVIGE